MWATEKCPIINDGENYMMNAFYYGLNTSHLTDNLKDK